MKITCVKNPLKEVLFLAEKNAGKILNMPILNGVYLKTENNSLKVISTNLETGFEGIIPAKVQKEGEVVVPVKILAQLVGASYEDKITLESVKNNLNVSTEKVSSFIKGYPIEDFPKIPNIKSTNKFDISAKDLSNALKFVQNAASISMMKPEISSVFFNVQNKNFIKIVATDSFRLAEKTLEYAVKNADYFLIPEKSASELSRILENKEDNVQIAFDKNQIGFYGDSFKFTSRLTEGSFPSYESVIPKKFSTEVLISRNRLIDAFRSASIFTGNLNEISLHIMPEDNLLEIRTKHSDIGEHTSQVDAKIIGEKITLNFNYHYVLDGLQNMSCSDVMLRFSGENRPLLIQEPNNSQGVYLVMPMKNA
ncbi:MAG: DNA polymerase III subunit beta [Candidatus Niyogibacteria bacterium]|nr:DNA polymerase III subunit beta [Candidatus Niyogibacteria bacterium]